MADEIDVAITIYLDRGPGTRILARAHFGPSAGVTDVDFVSRAGLRYVVSAPGFREVRGDLQLPVEGSPMPVHHVTLLPGFEREITLHDARTATPLVGAEVRDASGRTLGVSDRGGRVLITAAEWPETLSIELPGCAPLEWFTGNHWMSYSNRLWLECTQQGR